MRRRMRLLSTICFRQLSRPTITAMRFARVTAVYSRFRDMSISGPAISGSTTTSNSLPLLLCTLMQYASSSSFRLESSYSAHRPSSKRTSSPSLSTRVTKPMSPLNTPSPSSPSRVHSRS